MDRIAFKMQLKPGFEAEYQRRHDEIWPEMLAELRAAGVYDYSIFLDPETLSLFGVQKRAEGSTASTLAQKAIVQRWWAHMKDIMETNPDNSPKQWPLKEVFRME